MAKNISLMGANYPDVPAVQLPQTGGGTATFYDINVVDNLNSDSSTDALSAKQGKVLNSGLTTKLTGKLYYHTHTNISYDANGYAYVPLPQISGGINFPIEINCADALPRTICGRNWDGSTIVYVPSKAGQTDATLTIHYIVGEEAEG